MKTGGIYVVLCLVVVLQLLVPVYMQTLQSRHYRPNPNKCDRHGRCSAKEGYIEETGHDDELKQDKERPPELTRDDWPTRPHVSESDSDKVVNPGGGRPPLSDDYDDSYNLKPTNRDEGKLISDRPGGGYNPKPTVGRDDDLKTVIRPGGGYGGDHNPKSTVDSDDGLKSVRPIGSGGGYGGGYNPKPSVDKDDDLKPVITPGGGYGGGYNPKPTVDSDDSMKPSRPSSIGGGYGGVHNLKPLIDRDDDLKSVRISVSGGVRFGGGHNPKPTVDTEDCLKPARPSSSGGGYGGGHNSKPSINREDDLKSVGIRVSGGGRYGGGFIPKPAVKDDEINPTRGRPSLGGYGGGYNPKPVADRDDDFKSGNNRPSGGGGYGGGYNPKPSVDREDDIKSGRPGGGYNPKPGGGIRGGYNQKSDEDDYEIKTAVGVYPDNDRRPNKEDLGGYEKSKDGDYNDDYTDESKDDYDDGDKSLPVVDGKCICVPHYQCTDGHIVTDGAGIIDARKKTYPDEELPLDGKFRPPSCGPFHVCCNTPETSTVKPYEHRCGVRNPSGINSRILSPSNKGEADFGEWPWQAAVLKSEGKVNIFMCGGVLIDKYHVLTVAHCVFHLYQFNEYPLKVRLGEWDTQTTTEFLAHEDYRVSKIIVHPEFRNTSLWSDVAVLRLQDPVLFAPHIDTVCLPQYDEVFDGQNCVVTGWGKDAYKGGTFSNVMKEVALQVIDNYKCEEMLRKTRLGRFFQLHDGFLCAGGEYGLDSCKGDGGGPLVCYRKDKSYALAGIVSWGIDCGQPGVPGVYVKMQKYVDWISKTTGVTLQDYWPKH